MILSLTGNVDELEMRIEELSKKCEEAERLVKTEKRKNERLQAQIVKLELTCPVDVREDDDHEKFYRPIKKTNNKIQANAGGITDLEHKQSSPEAKCNSNISKSSNCTPPSTEKEDYPVTSTQVFDSYYRRYGKNLSMELSAICDKFLLTLNYSSPEDFNEELINLLQQVESSKKAVLFEKQRCTELEEQLAAISKLNHSKLVSFSFI